MGRYDDRRHLSPLCSVRRHKPVGTMSNQPGTEPFDPARAHASTHVCARSACQDDARKWVWAQVGQDAVDTTFEQNRAARAAQTSGGRQ